MAREVPSIFREKSVKDFDVFTEGCYVKVAMERGRLSFAYSEDGTDFDSKYMIGVRDAVGLSPCVLTCWNDIEIDVKFLVNFLFNLCSFQFNCISFGSIGAIFY